MTIIKTIRTTSQTPNISGKKSFKLPQPFGPSIAIDFLYLFILGLIQIAIIPTILPEYFLLDLVTPCLTLGFIILEPKRSMSLALVGAFIIETHSSTPAGLYLCAYLIIGTICIVTRKNVSWYKQSPWVSAFVFAQTWLFTCEFFVSYVTGGFWANSPFYYIGSFLKILLATSFGLWIIKTFNCVPSIREGEA